MTARQAAIKILRFLDLKPGHGNKTTQNRLRAMTDIIQKVDSREPRKFVICTTCSHQYEVYESVERTKRNFIHMPLCVYNYTSEFLITASEELEGEDV